MPPANARRRVASLSLLYRYFHGHCANSVAEMMPRPAEICRLLRNCKAWHIHRGHLCRARTVISQSSFIVQTSRNGIFFCALCSRLSMTCGPSKANSTTTSWLTSKTWTGLVLINKFGITRQHSRRPTFSSSLSCSKKKRFLFNRSFRIRDCRIRILNFPRTTI